MAEYGRIYEVRMDLYTEIMNNFDTLIAALSQVKEQQYVPPFGIWVLNPKDRKGLHVNKVSIRFM